MRTGGKVIDPTELAYASGGLMSLRDVRVRTGRRMTTYQYIQIRHSRRELRSNITLTPVSHPGLYAVTRYAGSAGF